MNILRPAFVLMLAMLAGCTQTWVKEQYRQPDRFATWVDTPGAVYRLQPGDDISVQMPFNAELNFRGTVAPDGSVSMPYAGVLPAAGASVSEFAARVDRALAANGIAADARATVTLVLSNARIYVGGQVAHPGEVPLRAGMSVVQALIAAAGVLDTARTGEIVLIRRAPDGRPMMRTIDLEAATQRGDPAQEVILQAADTIFVPKSQIAEVDQWIDYHINQPLPFQRAFNYTISNNPTNP